MSAQPSPTPPIAYAPPVPRARRLARRFALPAILLLVLVSAYWWGPPLWHRGQLAYWYDRALRHDAPPGTVVWQVRDGPTGFARVGEPYVPHAWRRFYALLSPPGFQSNGTAFLGGRRTPDGRAVLVAVDVAPPAAGAPFGGSPAREPGPQLHVRVFAPGGASNRPRQTLDVRLAVPLPRYFHARLFAGQPDPADPTHFTIGYYVDGLRGTIDGWVRTDAVDLKVGPPATN